MNLSTFKILLLSFNKTDFIKLINMLNESAIEHFINMHLRKNWLLQQAYLEYRILIKGWRGGKNCRQAAVLLTNYDITALCFNVL